MPVDDMQLVYILCVCVCVLIFFIDQINCLKENCDIDISV